MTVVGTVIGRYELLRLLAAGGMAEVYLARVQSSVEGFGALVAIKILPRHLSSNAEFVRMFLDEARIVGRLHHRNIVQIRDVAEQAGQYYMVMEYIPGQNLRELLGDASIPGRPLFEPRLGTELFTDIANALAAAHGEGLVHRDLSPNNIMIGDEGVPKLIDFGVARALTSTSLTSPGTLKGKFGYMAPEYVRNQPYDHRVDIFSLGVVMWETFARRRLFRGTSAAEQLHQLLESEIPRLDAELPDFPRDVATIVAGMLERDPQRRVSSAAVLSDTLSEVARSLPPGTHPTLRRWLERRVPGRLEDRRQTDEMLRTLAPGSPVPDFGISHPEAGSMPGTYAFQEPTTVAPHDAGNGGTSIRVANSETSRPPPSPTPVSSRRPWAFLLVGAVLAIALVMLVASRRGGERGDNDVRPATTVVAEPPVAPKPDASLIAAHRQIGLKAMADNDYAKARSEFSEAIKLGGTGDLTQLLAMVTQLERDEQEKLRLAKAPVPPPTIDDAPKVPDLNLQKVQDKKVLVPVKKVQVRNKKVPDKNPRDKRLDQHTPGPDPQVATAAVERSEPPPPAPGSLVVTSIVEKAVVLVDGAVIGQTPVLSRVNPGEHELVVRFNNQTLHTQKLSIVAGGVTKVHVEVTAPKTVAAPPPVEKRPQAPAPKPTPRVTGNGDVEVGARVVGACNGCHAKAGVSGVSGRRYTRAQWERFFANGQHDRYVPIGDQMSATQLMAARAFLRANAADTAEHQGAGVSEQP